MLLGFESEECLAINGTQPVNNPYLHNETLAFFHLQSPPAIAKFFSSHSNPSPKPPDHHFSFCSETWIERRVRAIEGEMTILYTLVARGSVVLAEFSGTQTNASTIARQVLEKTPGNDDMNVSYSQDRYIFHVKRTDGLTVLCMADDISGRRIPFAFLEEIHQRFVRTYGRAVLSAQAYSMNDEFSRVLSQQMEYYSNDPNADRINRLKGEMSQVHTVMIQNIDKVLERGDRLEILVDKTATMQNNTLRFKKQSRRYRNAVWWRNVKLMFALIFLLLVLVYVVVAFACNGLTLPSCIA